MATKKSAGDAPSLERKAQELISRKYKIKDPLLVDTATDELRATREPIHRFRVVSAAHANGPQYEVVLSGSEEELNLEAISQRDGVTYFPALVGGAPGAGA